MHYLFHEFLPQIFIQIIHQDNDLYSFVSVLIFQDLSYLFDNTWKKNSSNLLLFLNS